MKTVGIFEPKTHFSALIEEAREGQRRERLRNLIRQTEDLGLYDMEEFDLAPMR